MNKEERITYEEFMIMFKNAPRIAYTLYDKAEDEIERLNNIIDEMEKSWKEQQEHYRYIKDNRYRTFLSKNLDKLKELKEGK